MKQSSIEYVVDQLIEKDLLMIYGKPLEDNDLIEIIKQAKAMHKDEIENAYDDGWHHNNKDFYNPVGYYNETFNTNQENLQDSTNGYTYYPQENKTVFNIKGK